MILYSSTSEGDTDTDIAPFDPPKHGVTGVIVGVITIDAGGSIVAVVVAVQLFASVTIKVYGPPTVNPVNVGED